MNLNIKKLKDNAICPRREKTASAGIDVCACFDNSEDKTIAPGETLFIPTGYSFEIPEGYYGGLFARSGLGCKRNLRPANCVGVIDSDYRGELIVALRNDSNVDQLIKHGDRVAQLVIMPYLDVTVNEVDELSDTDRGENGFGSTGTK